MGTKAQANHIVNNIVNNVAVARYVDERIDGLALWRLSIAFIFACCLTLLAYHPTWAATFEVDSELDGVDSNIGDGICRNVTVAPGNVCTLRAAIQEANFTTESDTINLPAGTYILSIENFLDNAENDSATGDLDITTNIIIEGDGAKGTTIQASDELHDRVIHLVGEDAVAGLNRLTIRNGDTTELNGSTDGGGILVNGGKLDGFELVVSENRSPTNGGGIMVVGVNAMSLHRCTINGNSASEEDADGGGVYLGQNYDMTLANCTISNNEAGSRGGGINVSNNSGTAIILNTTVANNRVFSDTQGGGLYIGNNTDTQILNSIIANNFAEGDGPNDCYGGQINRLYYSLIEAPNAGDCELPSDVEIESSFSPSEDPLLGPLAYYGEGDQLQTHALLEGSIAIDAGSQLEPGGDTPACYATDARGQVRPARAYCDMGSFELPSALFMPMLEKAP